MSIKKAAARGRTGQAARTRVKDIGNFTTVHGAAKIPSRRFNPRLSNAIDLLIDLEELGSPIARRLRGQLERYIPA